MTEYGFHYLVANQEEVKKLVDSFKRREKKSQFDLELEKKYAPLLLNSKMKEENREIYDKLYREYKLRLSAELEKTLLLRSGNILSVYPILETEWQEKNNTWVKFDSRPKALAQKYASLFAIRDKNGKIGLRFLRQGNCLGETYFQSKSELPGLLYKFFPNDNNLDVYTEAIAAIHTSNSFYTLSELLGFPLLLPTDWEKRWKTEAITEHLFIIC